MKLWVNGVQIEINGPTNIAELAHHYDLQPNSVLIEHNQIALHPREWAEQKLGEGDRIEFVRVVAGG